MGALEIVLLAFGLALDASAVCLAAGASGRLRAFRPTFRLAFHFGLFQFMMPVIGWAVGAQVADVVSAVDHWIALGLLTLVGGRMIHAGLRGGEASLLRDPSRGWTLVLLSIATSIDALAVGLSLALVGVTILMPSLVIGLVTGALAAVAVQVGGRLGARYGRPMEVVGGLVLIGIGIRIVIAHTVGAPG